jgi:inorganic triphosphatase YgiF
MTTGEHEQIETERKYDVDTGFVLPDLTGAGGSVSMAPPDVQQLEATYFDTDDLRLIGARITLRRRTGGDDAGWHIKLPVGGDTRREVHFPLGPPGRVVPAEIATEVARWSGGAPLRPVARLETHRTVRRLLGESGEVLAEVADDQVTGSRPDPADPESWRLQDTWREVEVELKSGTPELLDAAAAGLAAAGARPSRSASKLARVLHRDPS